MTDLTASTNFHGRVRDADGDTVHEVYRDRHGGITYRFEKSDGSGGRSDARLDPTEWTHDANLELRNAITEWELSLTYGAEVEDNLSGLFVVLSVEKIVPGMEERTILGVFSSREAAEVAVVAMDEYSRGLVRVEEWNGTSLLRTLRPVPTAVHLEEIR